MFDSQQNILTSLRRQGREIELFQLVNHRIGDIRHFGLWLFPFWQLEFESKFHAGHPDAAKIFNGNQNTVSARLKKVFLVTVI
jgi:hypothetical protein